MNKGMWGALLLAPVLLAGCDTYDHGAMYDAPPPPPPMERYAAPIGPGAIAGTVAADRNGDGIVDGFYTSDGAYHPIQGPHCPPPPPPPPTRRGERG